MSHGILQPRVSMAVLAAHAQHHPTHQVHVVVMGKNGVGKSAFVVKYLTKRFIWEYDTFLENTYQKIEIMKPEDVPLRVSVTDTFDHELLEIDRLAALADIVILIYAINSVASFQRARSLLERIRQQTRQRDITLLLIGNKIDLEHFRVISTEEGQCLASDYGCLFDELSCAEEWQFIHAIFCKALRRHMTGIESCNSYHNCSNSQNNALSSKNLVTLESQISQRPGVIKQVSPNKKNSTATTLRFLRDKFAKK